MCPLLTLKIVKGTHISIVALPSHLLDVLMMCGRKSSFSLSCRFQLNICKPVINWFNLTGKRALVEMGLVGLTTRYSSVQRN